MNRALPRFLLGAAAACLLALAGCDYLPFGYTPIREIVAAPGQFEGKEVKIRGHVKGAIKVPIIDLKTYTLQDDTGEIAVVTQSSLPAEKDAVSLTGTVKSVAIIGGASLGLRVEEVKRR